MIDWLYELFGVTMICSAWTFIVSGVTWFFLGLFK